MTSCEHACHLFLCVFPAFLRWATSKLTSKTAGGLDGVSVPPSLLLKCCMVVDLDISRCGCHNQWDTLPICMAQLSFDCEQSTHNSPHHHHELKSSWWIPLQHNGHAWLFRSAPCVAKIVQQPSSCPVDRQLKQNPQIDLRFLDLSANQVGCLRVMCSMLVWKADYRQDSWDSRHWAETDSNWPLTV